MKARLWHVGPLMALGLISGCSGTTGTPFDPSLLGQKYYLCCNMGFNPSLSAADSNYGQYLVGAHSYAAGPMLPAGTRVTVVKVGHSGIQFQPEGSEATYTLTFSYGQYEISAYQYFHGILRDTNPMESVKATGPIAEGIEQGRLVNGMTKEEALIARGYPPAHQTPNLKANEWVYYDTPGFVDRVVFVDDKIQSITRGPAPE